MKTYVEPWALFSVKRRKDKIDPRPAYQRGLVWSLSQKQLLIDSILRGLDIPKFYLRKVEKPKYDFEIVDGQQRLSAIWEFLDNEWPLSNEADPIGKLVIANKKYEELEDESQDALEGYQITTVILENAEEEEIEDMFLRLQNGETLKAAEKRNAITGELRNFIRDLVSKEKFFSRLTFANKNYLHDEMAAQMLCLELAEAPRNIKGKDLSEMYKTNRAFDKTGAKAQRVKKNLKYLAKAFSTKTPELKRNAIPSVYFLISELVKNYAMGGREKQFGDWFIDFEKRRRKEEALDIDKRDTDLVEYQLKIQQSASSKESIEYRFRILVRDFFLYAPDIERLDEKRLFSEDQRIAIYRKDKGICQNCREKVDWDNFEADHIKPYSKGGKTTVENGQLLCPLCNQRKNNRGS